MMWGIYLNKVQNTIYPIFHVLGCDQLQFMVNSFSYKLALNGWIKPNKRMAA